MQKVLSNNDIAALVFREIQRDVIDGPTKLADLNADVLFLIFDHFLDIGDLLNLLQIYPDKMISSIANDVYWKKYNDHEVHVTGSFSLDDIQLEQHPKRIVVGQKSPLLLMLFGNLINNLVIHCPSSVAIQYVNRNGCNSFAKFNLKFINRLSPNLEHMTLYSFDIGKDSVHFKNVKRLRWERVTSSSIWKLSFSKLESLKIGEYRRHESHVWAEFFQRNTNLSRLHITMLDKMGYLSLVELTGKLPNLTKLTIIQQDEMLYVNVIGQLINANRNLRQFIFWTDKNIQNEVDILREQFEQQWIVQCNNYARWIGISFQKK